ncbi:Rrf2 family transcriptional regulator [Alkalibacter rhizosphaerae]|uniref:Rrf2 family transcriptional regulator n=1 Tax=Alkalibacter rhizosphaerae TaxID=2815577 RepID=A0A974XDP7_9FIRM|nr:Rrf2 family transcriptional regulator [Alkalibacter rhizosphaerae]QSX07761.1 Rrf2 family transcriptional regulator [Alkalibacter rhizosphaerae]
MKISTKGRYGIRAMVDLAVHFTGEHEALGNIAQRQGISNNYLEQVFSTLRKAGLVKSIKGSQGGYLLAKDPKEITAKMILEVLEGDLSVVDEKKEGAASTESIQYYLKGQLWEKINNSVQKVVEDITLDELAKGYSEYLGNPEPMYYI